MRFISQTEARQKKEEDKQGPHIWNELPADFWPNKAT